MTLAKCVEKTRKMGEKLKKILILVTTVVCILGVPQITYKAEPVYAAQSAVLSKTVGTVTANPSLNLRKSATTSATVLASIPIHTQVTIISKNSANWYNVTYNGKTGWVSGSYITVKTGAATAPVTGVSRSDSSELVDHALSLLGVPYVFGGTSRSGFDCSGYTQYVFKGSGISLPRTAAEQYTEGSSVSRQQLQSGDLVFFSTYAAGASHVGIYIGGDRFVAASNSGVSISSLDSDYYSNRYIGARRVR